MSRFAYLCLDSKGMERRSELDAADAATARRALREEGLKVLQLAEASAGGLRSPLRAFAHNLSGLRPVRDADRAIFFRQMNLMLRTGHTLIEALSAAGQLSEKPQMTRIIERIAEKIRRGNSLSTAADNEKNLFSPLAAKLIEAGEVSGELGMVFERLASLIDQRGEVRRQLTTALVYPGILILISIAVISFLVTTVIPRLATFFAGRGKSTPWAAQTLMDIADWFGRWGALAALAIVLTCLGLALLRKIPKIQMHIDRAVLAIPVIGETIVVAAMAQMTWLFSVLTKSRLTALESLRICAQSAGNAWHAIALEKAASSVLKGQSLALAFDSPAFPGLVRHMAAAGEKSGQMETVMESLGTHYQKALNARLKMLAAMFEPVLTVLIGGVVGFVYYAFFQAILTASAGG